MYGGGPLEPLRALVIGHRADERKGHVGGAATLPFLTLFRRPRTRKAMMTEVSDLVAFLLASPLLLVPILLVAAMMVFAILKRLLKLAAIVAIAGVLYVLLIEYVGSGM